MSRPWSRNSSALVLSAAILSAPLFSNASTFSARPYFQLEKDEFMPQVLKFTLGGGRLVVGYYGGLKGGGRIKIWDMYQKKSVKEIESHKLRVTALSVSPSGRYLASGGWDGAVEVHSLQEEKAPLPLKAHKGSIFALAFSPDGMTLASGGKDKKVVLWDVESGTSMGALEGHTKAVVAASYTPDGKQIVTASQDKTLRSWDPVSRQENRSITESAAQYGEMNGAAISPDGFMIASITKEVKAKVANNPMAGIQEKDIVGLRDFKTGELSGKLEGHLETINALDYSPDGRYIATAADDNSIMVWDLSTMKQVTTLDLKGSVLSVDFSSDGNYLAACDKAGGLYVWKLQGVSSFPLNVAGGRSYDAPNIKLPSFEGQPRRIAVMELKGKGKVDPDTASILTDSLRNFLQQTGRFEVVDRQNMEAIMKEAKFQLSGMVDESSAVQLGKLLGAKGMIFGSVSRLGSTYAISLSMTSIESGRVVGSSEERCPCSDDDLFLALSTAGAKLIVQ